jgi:transposase
MEINKIKEKRIFNLNYDELKHLYIELDYSQTDIANILNCDASNVSRKLKKLNIIKENYRETQSKKQLKNCVKITKDDLIRLYPKSSISEISLMYGVSTSYIYSLFKKFNIEIMKNGYFQKIKKKLNNEKLNELTKDKLIDLYVNKEIPAHKIGSEYNVDNKYIYRKLKEFDISIRSKKEAFNTQNNKKIRKEILIKNIGSNLTNFKPSYNKKSIPILESFAKDNGLKLQHAENGGEYCVEKYMYWLDGYDINENIAVEYYEEGHKYKKDYDSKRIKRIKKHLGCVIYIIHESGLIEIV